MKMNFYKLFDSIWNFFRFIINQLFDGSNPDDPNLKRHLTVYPENTSKKKFYFNF